MSEQDISELIDAPWEVEDPSDIEDWDDDDEDKDDGNSEGDLSQENLSSEEWHPKKRYNMDDKINEMTKRPESKYETAIRIIEKADEK